jgi:polar amino acid transport system substrate-binding protein
MRQSPLAVLLLSSLLAGGQAVALTFTTEDAPPFNFTEDGGKTIAGSGTEIVNEMLKRTGIQASISLYPWERAYRMGLEEADTCVYSTTRTEAREPLFKWVGPLASNNWTLFAKEGSSIALASLEDAKAYKIGGYQGDAVAVYLKENGFKVEETTSDPQNVMKLDAGRIELWAAGNHGGPFLAAKQGVKVKPLISFKETELYLACNKGIADELIAKMNEAIQAIHADGTAEAIYRKYQ